MGKYPKRRKDKYNPYVLSYIEGTNKYTVTFKDGEGIKQCVEITKEIYEAMNRFELDDLSKLNEFDNHIEHLNLTDDLLSVRALNKQISIEDMVERKIEISALKKAIDNLSDVQKRRIERYYFNDMTVEDIAKIDNTTHQAVSKSIRNAILEIKRFLKI